MTVLAVVPARSGSKGIPRKNLRMLDGKPLLAHQIETACAADGVDRTIVSTDDETFAVAARTFGAKVPFRRPASLAEDDVPVIAVYEHAMEYFDEHETSPEYIVGLQPTCPFTTPKDLDAAIEKIEATGCDSVVSVAPVEETHPYRAYTLDGDRLRGFEDVTVDEPLQRQDRPDAYGLTGAIFVRHRSVLEEWAGEDFALGEDTRAIVQDEAGRLDIDTPFELRIARALCQYDSPEGDDIYSP
ncbi:acylneuraminate cytidylyltransferase family protein [Haloarculaceae archaeon H-GB2-1]|nr:acylneuraminate cytidylyltransferase family protein [Haloarculaceae archaeon H-GB1-1]MEA5388459.1 acylneuraminate cytidylyltransferase family protein [Haloarculaceae archaeon H-GB11]MEA5406496.1 acylneuraminate cytidylyltransferase family protein [Haloarculaceae archaeon H-GB2-1]